MAPLPDIGLEKALAFDFLERNATQIALLGDSIFYFGELGMQEFETAKLMTQLLEEGGFALERGIDRGEQLVGVDRFGQEIGGAELHRAHAGGDVLPRQARAAFRLPPMGFALRGEFPAHDVFRTVSRL